MGKERVHVRIIKPVFEEGQTKEQKPPKWLFNINLREENKRLFILFSYTVDRPPLALSAEQWCQASRQNNERVIVIVTFFRETSSQLHASHIFLLQ